MNTRRLAVTALVVAMSLLVLFSSIALAADDAYPAGYEVRLPAITDSALDYSAVTTVIAGYFTTYYRSIEQLAVAPELADYIIDNDETHLYTCALQYSIDWRKASGPDLAGIVDTKVERVDIKYAKQSSDRPLEVVAAVGVGFRYLADPSQTRARAELLWEIGIDTIDGDLRIASLNSEASDYRWRKAEVEEKLRSVDNAAYTKTDAIDELYAELHSQISSHVVGPTEVPTPGEDTSAEEEDKAAAVAASPSIMMYSRPYDGYKAAYYGRCKGDSAGTGIFRNMHDCGGYDCTNFVSQCIWAGYGGTQNYDITTQQGMAACAQLARQDYRQIRYNQADPWYGRSVLSPPTYPAQDWISVDYLYGHIQTDSMGPRGTHHNNHNLYNSSIGQSLAVYVGHVIQIDHAAYAAPYYHSMMVVSSWGTLSNPYAIYVAQHDGNYSFRQFYDAMYENNCWYARTIRFTSGSFNE